MLSLISRVATAVLVMALAGCGQTPIKPADAHLRAAPPRAEGVIPSPVQTAPLLPTPAPILRPETYSVVVHNVPAQELLFALARDAKLQIGCSRSRATRSCKLTSTPASPGP